MKKHIDDFDAELNKLFKKRTIWLRDAIQKGVRGRPPRVVQRKNVSKRTKKLQR
jgi:hypothetical protein